LNGSLKLIEISVSVKTSTKKIAFSAMGKVQKFYEDKVILLTGATGFCGKVLCEKLLRDCGSLRNIYILIRTKRNGKKGFLHVLSFSESIALFRKLPAAFREICGRSG